MFTKEHFSFLIVVALSLNAIWFISKISNRGELPSPEIIVPASQEAPESPSVSVLPAEPRKLAAWDDASSFVSSALACVEWGPIPDAEVLGVKSVLVASQLHDKIMIRETPFSGKWAVSFEVPEGKSKALLAKATAKRLEITDRPDGTLFAGPFSSEKEARQLISEASAKAGLSGTLVVAAPPSLNTFFILTDDSDESILSFKRAASMLEIGELHAAPCPGAFMRKGKTK